MQNKAVKILITIVSVVVIAYVGLSLYIGKVLNPVEFGKFINVVSRAALLHGDGLKALHIIKEATSSQSSNVVVHLLPTDTNNKLSYSSHLYSIPLPKYAVFNSETSFSKTYLIILSDQGLQNYFDKDLKSAGWEFSEQLGSLYEFMGKFEGHNARLRIIKTYYLTNSIIEMSYSVVEI